MNLFNDKSAYTQGIYPPPEGFSPARFAWKPAVLLLVITLICFLLFEAVLAFPGFYFWFIGGDLMQLWFLVLVILGIMYWRTLPRAGKTRTGRVLAQRGNALATDYSGNLGSFSLQQKTRTSPSLLLRLPLVLLLVFLVYYFFIQGYTFHINPHPTVMGNCNVGSITIEGNTTANTVSLKAGLLTLEASGNYDQSGNIINLEGNLCGLTLSVPAESNLHLSGNDAELSVTGVKGKLELDNNAGNIIIKNCTLLGGSVVSNNAGEIDITNSTLLPGAKVTSNDSPIHITSSAINGASLPYGVYQIEKSTLTGSLDLGGMHLQDDTLSDVTINVESSEDIEITNATVKGSTKIIGNSSTIGFTGTLTAGSSLSITNNSGQESITLPASLAFHLDASGISSVNSNYEQVQGLDPTALASSDGVHVDIGSQPQATIAIQGMEDTLTLNKGNA